MEALFAALTVGIGILAVYLKMTTPDRPAPPRRYKPPDHPTLKSPPAVEWDLPVPTQMHIHQARPEQNSPAPPRAS
jgi:hypothetical protein